MNRCLAFGFGFLLLTVAAHAAEISARVGIDGNGRLQLSGLPAVLDDTEVQRHLSSGLTTSFLFRVRPPRPMEPGASRIDIRLELWDEVFLVSLIDGEGRLSESQHPTAEALRKWWSELAVVVAGPSSAAMSSQVTAKVSLDVIPFSQAELSDTQRWLAESMGQAQAGARPGEGGISRAVGALIATSMQRRSVRSWVWSVPVERLEMP